MYNKTIIEFGFCDIRNNQGLGKCNQPWPRASADYTCLDLDYSRYHKKLIQLLFIIVVIIIIIIIIIISYYIKDLLGALHAFDDAVE